MTQLSFNFTREELRGENTMMYHVSNMSQVLLSTNDPIEAVDFFLKLEEPSYIWSARDGVRDVMSFRLVERHVLMDHILKYYDVITEDYESFKDKDWETVSCAS